ncbi:hypothetical protein IT401_01335 [Candidatus Nomurabacteria bacterium]|nr:hypothetical protein [Candidatus Nomurabacteria bacterium]
MKDIQKIFFIEDKKRRYDKLVNWIFSKIFKNKGAILEWREFSEQRTVCKNGKKLLAHVIFSKDPESSAWIGPAIAFKIFECESSKV